MLSQSHHMNMNMSMNVDVDVDVDVDVNAAAAVMVGVKWECRSREMLTWSLAKFSRPGDRVVAVHVSSHGDGRDAHFFHSVSGVYDDFCRLHKIDLQLKVIMVCAGTSSAKQALVKAAKSYNAVRLILGTRDNNKKKKNAAAAASSSIIQPPRTFPIAMYCSRHLSTSCCSVLVIHYGRVVYERAGAMRREAWSVDSLKGKGTVTLSIEVQKRIVNAKSSDESRKTCDESPLQRQRRIHPLLFCFFHPYNYLTQLEQRKTGSSPHCIAAMRKQRSVQELKGSFQKKTVLLKWKEDEEEPANLAKTAASPCLLKCWKASCRANAKVRCNSKAKMPIGWPLLHHSISVSYVKNKHPMTVIEWALQLPERTKPLQVGCARKRHASDPSIDEKSRLEMSSDDDSVACTSEKLPQPQRDSLLCKTMPCLMFEFAELERATNHFSMDNIIGKGGCSEVYRGMLWNGCTVAIKSFSNLCDSERAFFTEMEIVRGLQHPHIVRLIGYCISDCHRRYLLVYTFAPEGDLEQKLHGKDKTVVPWNIRYKVAVGVAEALAYLHNSSRPVIHRDIKSSNIVLLSDLSPQLTDFGLSKWAPATSSHLICNDVVGTFGYLAPEYFMFGKVNDKTDVYSFGVVLLELISGQHPTQNRISEENLVTWAKPLLKDESSFGRAVDGNLKGQYNAYQLKNMMFAASLCLRQSPLTRPCMTKILHILKEGHSADAQFRQEPKSIDDCYDNILAFNDCDLRNHLNVALCDLDDDDDVRYHDQSMDYTNSNKFIEEYLQQRYSRSSSLH